MSGVWKLFAFDAIIRRHARLYAEAFGPAPYPARTTCVVQALPDPKMLIEIEGVASLAES
jgi:enamine deaminase RidA (YjgF/YER057c/UK114 family)